MINKAKLIEEVIGSIIGFAFTYLICKWAFDTNVLTMWHFWASLYFTGRIKAYKA